MPDPAPKPIVLIEIDRYSRLRILQESGVRVAFVDYRVERDMLTIMPEVHQTEEIMAAIAELQIISPKSGHDDLIRTALATIQRIGRGGVVVAKGPGR